MKEHDTLWKEDISTIVKSYKETQDYFICVICGAKFEKGSIVNYDGDLHDAYGAVKRHVKEKHGYLVDYLLNQNVDLVGISETQNKILKLMSEGNDDKTIAENLGIAHSTVRNHRFKLRENLKQAKLFAALMESLEQKTSLPINLSMEGDLVELHYSANMMDDRYNITDMEREKVIKTYIDENGAIKQFPAKEKKKIILLREIIKNFIKDHEYAEPEVNKILHRIYEDHATIRRALIEYGFLERSEDCKIYRVRE
ncbi:MAG: DUF2087 domain-containing protein [Lachnotalea sp.]